LQERPAQHRELSITLRQMLAHEVRILECSNTLEKLNLFVLISSLALPITLYDILRHEVKIPLCFDNLELLNPSLSAIFCKL
jgi:hypothetical protein